jgi:hypothetical protein
MPDSDDDAAFEGPANEAAGKPGAQLPSIVAFEVRRHRSDAARTDETVAARAETFLDLMRALFARKV